MVRAWTFPSIPPFGHLAGPACIAIGAGRFSRGKRLEAGEEEDGQSKPLVARAAKYIISHKHHEDRQPSPGNAWQGMCSPDCPLSRPATASPSVCWRPNERRLRCGNGCPCRCRPGSRGGPSFPAGRCVSGFDPRILRHRAPRRFAGTNSRALAFELGNSRLQTLVVPHQRMQCRKVERIHAKPRALRAGQPGNRPMSPMRPRHARSRRASQTGRTADFGQNPPILIPVSRNR